MFRCEARRPQEDGWRREGRASPPQVGHLWKLFAQISIIWSWKLYLKEKCEKNPSFYSRFYKWTFQSFCNLEKCFIYNSRILSLFQQFGPDRSAELLRFSLSEERRGSFLANSSQLPFHSSFPYHLPIPQFFLNNPG